MAAFRFFNPWSVLENTNIEADPAKVAKVAKAVDDDHADHASRALATLAGLAEGEVAAANQRSAQNSHAHSARAANDAKSPTFDPLPLKTFAGLATLAEVGPVVSTPVAELNIETEAAKSANVLNHVCGFSGNNDADAKVEEDEVASHERGAGIAAAPDNVADAIEERLAIIAETCPSPYADAFARLSHQRPYAVPTLRWERAVNDAGLFLDVWGKQAAAFGWTPGDLFDLPRADHPGGLIWRLRGERVKAIAADHAHLASGRTLDLKQVPI